MIQIKLLACYNFILANIDLFNLLKLNKKEKTKTKSKSKTKNNDF